MHASSGVGLLPFAERSTSETWISPLASLLVSFLRSQPPFRVNLPSECPGPFLTPRRVVARQPGLWPTKRCNDHLNSQPIWAAPATLRLVTRRFPRVIYRIALERFDPACYFARTGSDGGFDSGVRV